MMELGIITDFDQEFETIEEIEESLKQIAEAGFTHMHWCYDWTGDYLYAKSEMQQIREWMDQYGLKAKSLHASRGSDWEGDTMQRHYRKDYTSTVEYNRIAGVEIVQNRVELAYVLGASEIVLHMYLPFKEFEKNPESKEVFYGQVYRSLDELLPFCRERKVRICVENLYESPGDLQIEQFERLFSRYEADFLGLCLDTGHANLVWGNAFISEFADRFKDRLYSIHMHDNFGWGSRPGCNDAHMLPGECGIDWSSLMSVLRKSAYEGPWVLEVMKPAGEDPMDFLRRAHRAGEWVDSL